MDNYSYTILAVVLVGIAIIVGILVMYKRRDTEKSFVTGMARMLKRKGKLRGWRVFTNLLLVGADDDATSCHHAVVSPYGVFIITDIGTTDDIYAERYGESWTRVVHGSNNGSEKIKVPNYIKQNSKAISAFRHILATEKIYNVTVDGFVVMTDKARIYISDAGENVLTFQKFAKVLDKIKYETDNGTDIAQLSELLRRFVVEK